MLRFIDIRGQGADYRFAFYNTISSDFVRGDSSQGWDDKEGIEKDQGLDLAMKERMITLLPGWAEYLDEEDDEDINKGRVPNTVSRTYEEIRSEMDRYGNSPHDKLFPLLDLITNVNTDLYHGGVGFDPVNDIYKELDRLSEELFGESNILTRLDRRVLAFYTMLTLTNGDEKFQKKNRLEMLGTDDIGLARSLQKLMKTNHLHPSGYPVDFTCNLNS